MLEEVRRNGRIIPSAPAHLRLRRGFVSMNTGLKQVVIAVDVGTTSTKTLVVDKRGRILASHTIGYPLFTPKPDVAEQSPLEIYQAVTRGIREVLWKSGVSDKEVLCVSFSSAMHSLIAVYSGGNPLTPCITWADNRSVEYVDRLKREHDGHSIYRRTGTPIHPMSPLLKLMWLKDNEPDIFENTYKFVGIKEFILSRLFGRYVIDYSIASATGLFNLESLTWDKQALELAGVSEEKLPEPVPTTYRLEGLQTVNAIEMGLSTGTPFIVGASDGVLANLGVGAADRGVYAVTIGTSGAVRGTVAAPVTDPEAGEGSLRLFDRLGPRSQRRFGRTNFPSSSSRGTRAVLECERTRRIFRAVDVSFEEAYDPRCARRGGVPHSLGHDGAGGIGRSGQRDSGRGRICAFAILAAGAGGCDRYPRYRSRFD
jgi:sugar (pentulose or hexulose) kinase